MKVDLLVIDDDDNQQWIDFYIIEEMIFGFYVPIKSDDDLDDASINVYLGSDFVTLKQTPELLKYLKDNIVDNKK